MIPNKDVEVQWEMAKAESSKHKAIETSLMGTNEEKALCHSLFSISTQKKEEEEPQKGNGWFLFD